jgi:hypothetical protein
MASNPWLKAGELFPAPTAFMKAIQDQVISINNYKKYILNDFNITICAEIAERN